MRVYVDRLPDDCDHCVCCDDYWRCGIIGKSISYDGRREDCPLKVIVHCKDCRWDESCCRNIRTEGRRKDDYCSYGEKQIASKLNNPDDSLLAEDSEGVKEQESKLEPETLQLSPETSTKGTYIRDGRLMHDLVYRGEAEVTDTVEESRSFRSPAPDGDGGDQK